MLLPRALAALAVVPIAAAYSPTDVHHCVIWVSPADVTNAMELFDGNKGTTTSTSFILLLLFAPSLAVCALPLPLPPPLSHRVRDMAPFSSAC